MCGYYQLALKDPRSVEVFFFNEYGVKLFLYVFWGVDNLQHILEFVFA